MDARAESVGREAEERWCTDALTTARGNTSSPGRTHHGRGSTTWGRRTSSPWSPIAGGGYSFYKDARLRRITRYRYNDVPPDSNGRLFYIRDGETVWNPGWRPTRAPLDSYECRHGLGYTRIQSTSGGASADLLVFVPAGADCEVQRLVLKNVSKGRKSFDLFVLTEFCLWNAMDDMTNFQRNLSTGEVEVEDGVIYHKTEYRERRNHFAFFSVNAPVEGFETDRERFTGPYNGYDRPQAVIQGKLSGTIASGWSPVGAFHVKLDLKPGESKSLIFLLGYVENPDAEKWSAPGVINKARATALRSRFDSDTKVDAAFRELSEVWRISFRAFASEPATPGWTGW